VDLFTPGRLFGRGATRNPIAVSYWQQYLLLVNFPNRGKKSTQAVARLIEESHGPIDYLRLVKLIYLADRESIIRRGVPIVGGHYHSMKKGPTVSEIMNFVGTRTAPDWKKTISPRHGAKLSLLCDWPDYGALSDAEIELLDHTVGAHRSRTTEELVEWCHENCSEYEEVPSGRRKPIAVEAILKAAGKTRKQIEKVIQDANEIEEMDELLA
jgi:hypothetical protein